MWANRNYRKSNKITCVHFCLSQKAIDITKALFALSDVEHRQVHSTELLDELCDLAGTAIVDVQICAKKQYHKRSGTRVSLRQYGLYKPNIRKIYIDNFTAVRGQPLAAKSFFNTLLHEWMHHYDTYKLRINSIHSKGFYTRLLSLQKDLLHHL